MPHFHLVQLSDIQTPMRMQKSETVFESHLYAGHLFQIFGLHCLQTPPEIGCGWRRHGIG